MATNLNGKVALITGASRGIGRATAEKFAENGAVVVIGYVTGDEAALSLVSDIEAKGGRASAVQADVTNLADIRRLFETTLNQYSKLDIFVNNAGIYNFLPVVNTSEEFFDSHFAINTKGAFFCLQEAAKVISNGGRIINISTAATVNGTLGGSVYLGSKAATESFALCLAKELGERNVTVNNVLPGPTLSETFSSQVPPERLQQMKHFSPLNRLGEPQDIANVIALLVSQEAAWLTGQNIRATGGLV